MMKWILFLLPTITFASDFIAEKRIAPEKDLVIHSEPSINYPDKGWSLYLADRCQMYDRNVANEDELRQKGLRRCRDGSVSFIQPQSDGWNGWEGKCGQTAASNSLYHLCKKAMDPEDYVDRYMSDITPGVRPKTLRKGLRKIFSLNKDTCPTSERWIKGSKRSLKDFIANIKQDLIPNYSHPNLLTLNRFGKSYFRNPVLILIQNPGGNYLHWVTVIDIISNQNKCDFVVNHWNKQYYVPCDILAQWSEKVGRTYPIILRSFSAVTYK